MIEITDDRLDMLKKYYGSISVEGEEQDEIVLRIEFDRSTAERVYGKLCMV